MTMTARLLRVDALRTSYKSWCAPSSTIRRPSHWSQDLDHVLVVVTRYFGGIHLGPDRFKHINQAARNALEVGGFLDEAAKKSSGKTKH